MQVGRVLARIKDHPLVAVVIALGTMVVTLSTFTDAAKKLFDALAPHGREAARSELSKMSLQYAPEVFVEMVRKGDMQAVKLFLTAGMDPNAEDRRGKPALMHALSEGHTQIVDALLKAKADVNAEWNGETAVSWKACGGNVDTLRVWLDKGANAKTINGAFISAASCGRREVMQFLLARGADVNQIGGKALQRAVARTSGSGATERDQIDTVKFLLDLGVDVNTKDTDGETPLMEASYRGSTAMVRSLLDRGADPNLKCASCSPCAPPNKYSRGCTALMVAVNSGNSETIAAHRETVAALLNKGANPNEKSDYGYTALMLTRDAEITRALLNSGTDVNARDNEEGMTALMWLLYSGWGSDAVVSMLLEGGADVHVRDNAGHTALTWAAIEGSEKTVRMLLSRDVEVNPKTVRGRTPLMFAVRNGYPTIVRALLERGAHPNEVDITGKTALQHAQELATDETKDEIVYLLKQAGAK